MSSIFSPSAPSRSVFTQIEVSPFLNDYTREVVSPSAPTPRGLARQFKRQRTVQKWLQKEKPERKPRPWHPLRDYVLRRRNTFAALLPIASALVRIILVLYLFVTYYSLPPDATSGEKPPRIAQLYSIFPFVSCVGSMRIRVYQGMTLSMVLLSLISTIWTWYGTKDDFIGFESRRTQLLASLVGAGLSSWVVFAAENPDRELHLVVTAAEILSVFCIRTAGMYIGHLERKSYPGLWTSGAVRFLFWWKTVTLVVCLPLAIMTDVAIFGCHNATPAEIQTPGSRCYRIMALGAPSEWFYNFATISWTLTIAFDIYIGPITGKIRFEQDDAEMRQHHPERYTSLPDEDYAGDMQEAARHSPGFWKESGSQNTRDSGYESFDQSRWNASSMEVVDDADLDLGLVPRTREVV